MCGIVGAIAKRPVANILLNGLAHLEYRGYDSAGLALIDTHQQLHHLRVEGKVAALADAFSQQSYDGILGIAHTRWATHGKPSVENAHPHVSHDKIAVVHNGIIENHEIIKEKLQATGYDFSSDTDTEVVAHLIHHYAKKTKTLLAAVQQAVSELTGAYGLGVISLDEPDQLIAVRSGSPLVIGIGIDEHFIASDPLALAQLTQQVCYLEEGDVAVLTDNHYLIYDKQGKLVTRNTQLADQSHQASALGQYRHYMQKEIFEQVDAVTMTLADRLTKDGIQYHADVFEQVEHVQIIACGTSYHAGLVARYWLERYARLTCSVEVASEFRYRQKVLPKNALVIFISQSGETADLLAALRDLDKASYLASLAICNVPMSTLTREADLVFMTKAGAEVGVASTKAFTAQLSVLAMLTILLAEKHLSAPVKKQLLAELNALPSHIAKALTLDATIEALAKDFQDKNHSLFLGRGVQYPIAMEGALKLKEISYIHAEAYPAGELKHGPLALVDSEMPVISCAPDNALFEKLKSNLQEVRARGGELIIFTDKAHAFKSEPGIRVFAMDTVPEFIAPIVYVVPLQLLSYHVAVIKGTDVDKPRNLAKSVTVE